MKFAYRKFSVFEANTFVVRLKLLISKSEWIISRYLFVSHAMILKLKDRCLIGDYVYMYISRNPDIRSQLFKMRIALSTG